MSRRSGRLAAVMAALAGVTGMYLAPRAPASAPSATCADARPPSGMPAGAAPGNGSFVFTAGGDMGCSPEAAATLEGIHTSGADFSLHFGDMAYDQAPAPYEQTWCDFVHARVGQAFPYEIVTGGHDLDEGSTKGAEYEGSIDKYVQCMPDLMGSTSVNGAGYGKEYYFDHPAVQPLARFIMISPSITMPDGTTYDYTANPPSAHYQWLVDAIDGARAAGIRWVIVGTARNCITAGEKHCEIGQDVFNLLVDKKVDLILQGHEHGYERSKQLTTGPDCPVIPVGAPAPAGCIAADGSSGTYTKGAGPVLVIAGTLGIEQRPMYPQDPEASDFVTLMGGSCQRGVYSKADGAPLTRDGAPCARGPAQGFVKYTVSAQRISAEFVADKPGAFTDVFEVSDPNWSPAPAPTATSEGPGPAPATTAAPSGDPGYWMLGASGTVYPFGAAHPYGDGAPGVPAVHLEPTPSGQGYWLLEGDGHVVTFGDAAPFGDVTKDRLAPREAVSSLSATPSGRGYWVFTNRGRVLPFGDAAFLGDVSDRPLNGPVLGSVSTPSGNGYYMVASDGGIFAFGDARFMGSMGGAHLNAPVQSLVPTRSGNGYWLVASDGGIFAFGDARFAGSMGGTRLVKPVVGMVRYADGYLMVGADGGIFDFSSAPFLGSLGANPPAKPIVSVAALG
ncbi:MAG: metallophosphoesterase [Actinobacteria bacterium]|nr:metallophosphoesterase [Actinomycetota bacterium]